MGTSADGHGLPGAVGLPQVGGVGRERQQAADGIARAVHGARFDQLGDGVQRHDHGRLGPLADDEGARDGHRHQRVDVQAAVPQGGQALAEGAESGQCDGCGSDRQAHPLRPRCVRDQEGQALGCRGKGECSQQAGQAGAGGGSVLVFVVRSNPGAGRLRSIGPRVNLESGVPDGLHCCQCSLRLAGNAQAAFAQLETQPQDTRDALDSATDLGLLAGTVHRRDSEALATTQGVRARKRRARVPRRHSMGHTRALAPCRSDSVGCRGGDREPCRH
jgi:hypothetical protein